MKKLIYLSIVGLMLLSSCDKDNFLDKPPIEDFTDDNFWTSEVAIRSFAFGFYPHFFDGYGAGWSWGNYFTGQSFNDDFGPTSPSNFQVNVPTSGGGWSFAWIRKANIFVNRLEQAPLSEEKKNHWLGVARFFRGMAYYEKVNQFGDLPWYDRDLQVEDTEELYKPRDPRSFVMSKVLEDFKFAAENVMESDGETGPNGLVVNKWVVLAFMSRVFLFEGTWEKYHNVDQSKSQEFLEIAKWAAGEVINSGKFSLNQNYRASFNSLDLSGNKEMILYKYYEAGQTSHTLVSYSNREGQTGLNKDFTDTYLDSLGKPISISQVYKGDKLGADAYMFGRDFRMKETIFKGYRPNGSTGFYPAPYNKLGYSTTGFAQIKFLNEEIMNTSLGLSLNNTTDAPIIRYGEVLINYAEAAAELGNITQEDLDKSINVLRQRPGSNMTNALLQVVGGEPAVNGVVYDDPNRDADVPSMIWEIRRERRVELSMEGLRFNDLRRWKKLEYMDMVENADINMGAWIDKDNFVKDGKTYVSGSVSLNTGSDEGYIIPGTNIRTFDNDEKQYLSPIPLDQIKLYKDQGATLEQNPGWASE